MSLRNFTVVTLTIFSIKSMYLGSSRDPRYLSSQTYFCPAAIVARSCLVKQSGAAKRTVRKDWVLTFLQFFYSPFFQLNCYFWGDRVIRDLSAHRRIFAPPPPSTACVYKKKRRCKKNGDKRLGFDIFTVLLLTIFSIKLQFLGRSRDLRYLSSQTYFCPTTTVARLRLSKQNRDAKRTVINDWVLTFLQFFYSPFFQLNSYFWGDRVIHNISAHRHIFAPPPP